jgi:hypothetical protein
MENSGGAVVGAFTGVTGASERKKGRRRPLQALCGTFTPTANISFSKLTRFNTRLRGDEARYGAAKARLRL